MNSIVVRGTFVDARHIELDVPVEGVAGDVEVQIRVVSRTPKRDVLDVIRAVGPGSRSKEAIDRELREDRDQWTRR